ncbi:hypothetical protein C0Q70_00044 [Pomacea canaliculata]|uniref:DBB domain-containing protein n=1 Tax=Pomacea canaliculata TaxID=400727 RepID=A0A2T7PVK2_POMCA|nr:hypothetical protein C0Q70_00044 [Pomacea canaliculata]
MPQGKHRLVVTAGGRTQRTELTYIGVETAFCSTHYLCQCLGVSDDHELDLRLKDIFVSSLPGDNVLDAIFKGLPDSESTDSQKNANCRYPTLLHFAAAKGLAELCSALVECPGSSRAYYVRNCDGLDPADLAFQEEFDELGNYIIDFMTMQHAEDLYAHYVTLRQPDDVFPGDDLYEDMSRWSRSPVSPLRTAPPPPAPTSPRAPPQLPPRAQSMDNVLKHVPVDQLKAATLPNPRRNPPPVPPDPAAFMGMTGGQTGVVLPRGAVGSRTQSELIEIHELFKSGEISINEAQMLFNSWQQRCGRNTAVSFKDRQKELEKIRSEYLKKRKDSGKEHRDIFSWVRKGKNKESIRPNISEPVVPRQSTKSVSYFKPKNELLIQDRSSTASTGSSSSSRDSGWSVGSRESSLSASVEKSDSENPSVARRPVPSANAADGPSGGQRPRPSTPTASTPEVTDELLAAPAAPTTTYTSAASPGGDEFMRLEAWCRWCELL